LTVWLKSLELDAPSSLRVAFTVMVTGVVGNDVLAARVIRKSCPPDAPTDPVGVAVATASEPTLIVTVPVVADTFFTSAVMLEAK
jgi:hypothetical protein